MEAVFSDRVNPNSQNLPTIPEDIIFEILLRLPVKPLLRLKLVCKIWYNLIISPSFISMHHNFGTQTQLLMCSSYKYQTGWLDHMFSFRSNDRLARPLSPDIRIPATLCSPVQLVGSCNGIVCFYDHSTIFLSNPATRKCKELPPTSMQSQESTQIGLAFGFDSRNIYDFKVLRVYCVNSNPKSLRAEMFTLSSNTWRHLDVSLDEIERVNILDNHGLFFANSFHFISHNNKAWNDIYTIIYCDIHTERFKTIDLPSEDDQVKCRFSKLLVFKEFLTSASRKDECLDIWIMKDYGVVESWTKVYRIWLKLAQPLCFWNEDDALLLSDPMEMKLVSCNRVTPDLEDVYILGYSFGYPYSFYGKSLSQFVIYKETLVSIMSSKPPIQ